MTECVHDSVAVTRRDNFDRLTQQITLALLHTRGTHTLDDVWQMIEEDLCQFWYGSESFMVTEIVDKPQMRIVHVFLAGGRMEEIQAMYPLIVAWAKSKGCVRATISGRKGWARSFLKYDEWEEVATLYEKSLQGSDNG